MHHSKVNMTFLLVLWWNVLFWIWLHCVIRIICPCSDKWLDSSSLLCNACFVISPGFRFLFFVRFSHLFQVGHVPLAQTHTQIQNSKSDKQLFTVKQLPDKNSQNPINYVSSTTTSTTATSTIVSSRSEFSNNSNNSNNNLQYRPSERNKSSTVCQSFQQRIQERPSPPSYQQVRWNSSYLFVV